MSEPTPIKAVPIAPRTTQSDPKRGFQNRRIPWFLLFVPVVLVVAYGVFEYVPTVIPDVARTLTRSATSEQPPIEPLEVSDLPFRDIELERAQEKARATLRQFGQLQDRVESEDLGLAIYQNNYDAIINQANDADGLFAKREYPAALEAYTKALTNLSAYVVAADEEFQQEYELGLEHLNSKNIDSATQHLSRASQIKPSDLAIEHALGRLEQLPRIKELIREAERSRLRGEFAKAQELLNEIRSLDPETTDLEKSFEEINNELFEDEFNASITRALAAFNKGSLNESRQHFNDALRMRPNAPAAVSGLQRIQQRETEIQIDELRKKAVEHEELDDFPSAATVYSEILAINPNLQLAREGKDRVTQISQTQQSVNKILADPASLASTQTFIDANETLKVALGLTGLSNSLDQSAIRLREALQNASQPTTVTLISDKAMEVRLSTVGDLGLFDRKEISLRPGRYLLTGSGHGCRDVRKTILVEQGMEPVAIVCDEPI